MSDEPRKDPDQLLAAIQKEEASRQRGKLKIFLGMSPGVGKTYAMLEAAQREIKSGRDLLVGLVETHGRTETEALTQNLPKLPRRVLEHRNLQLEEFDLDAALARRPRLILVDELAHTNAPGSRHPKRYQDVLELLDHGIDVYTTLNVQHVGSRAEIVREITQTPVLETVPDSVIDQAEIELVDLPPGELLKRLEEGKVYMPDRARTAMQNFFRQGNLTALRELALRLAAEHVGQDVRDYLHSRQIPGPWKTGQRLMVAISPSPLSESMARWTRKMADTLQASWLAVHVDTGRKLDPADEARLQKNLTLARELGAEVITTAGEEVVAALLKVARSHHVTQIVAGKPASGRLREFLAGGTVLSRLIRESGNIDVLCVRVEGPDVESRAPHLPRIEVSALPQYLSAVGVVVGTTCLNLLIRGWTGYYVVSLVYLLGVVGLGLFVGRGPNLMAAALSALLWDYLFVPPLYTFAISNLQDGVMFGSLFVVALAMGQLTTRLRIQQAIDREREERATALYLLTRELAEAKDLAQLLGVVARQFSTVFQADIALLLPATEGAELLTPYPFGTFELSDKETSVALWAYRNQKPAGKDTDTLPLSEALHLPLVTPGRCVGVVGLKSRSGSRWSIQQRNLLDTFTRQIALVLDRQRLSDAEGEAKLVAESERLGKTLLNSISHELRTPIAAIQSAVAILSDLPDAADPATRRQLTAEVQEASQRLNRLVGNLLDITRLESGHLTPKLDWCEVSDWVNVTVSRSAKELANHVVKLEIAPGLPLVRMDFVLMEQALRNLLTNAAIHAPHGTTLLVCAAAEGEEWVVTVADEGSGIPEESLDRVFEKFYRAPGAPAGGTGLGLSIVKGFVEAQGGRVMVRNRPEGGALFTLRMPLHSPPTVEGESS